MWRTYLLVAALALAFAVHTAVRRPGGDYIAYQQAGTRLLAGEQIYRLADEYQFKYSPPVALVFAALALLPQPGGKAVLVFFTVLALAFVARWARASTGAGPSSHAALLLLAPHMLQLMSNGQVDGLLMGLAVMSEQQAQRRPIRSGMLLAAAALVKPPYLVLTVPALWHRQGLRFLGLALGFALGVGLTWVTFGSLAPFLNWRALMATTTSELFFSPSNEGLVALACTYAGRPGSFAFTAFVGVLGFFMVALVIAAVARNSRDPEGRFLAAAGALYLCAFLSPLGWWSNLIGLIPFVYYLVARLRPGPRPVRVIAGAALATGAVAAFFNHHLLGFTLMEPINPWHHYGLAGLVLATAAAGLAVAWPIALPVAAAVAPPCPAAPPLGGPAAV